MWANAQRDGRPAEYGWRPVLRFKFRRQVFLESVVLQFNATGRQQIPIIKNSILKRIFPNI